MVDGHIGPLAPGIIAALTDFIPNFGPVMALAPTALIALIRGPQDALYVILLFFFVHPSENYFIEPFIGKRSINVLPAPSIALQPP